MAIPLDRGSVHAEDDIKVQTIGYLPSICGGETTRIICSSEKPTGVLAQQKTEPKLTVPADSMAGEYFGEQLR